MIHLLLLDSMHFTRRWRRPPSLSRVNFAATTSRRSSSRAGELLCSFSNTTAATRSSGGWSPSTAGLPLLWCSTNWGKHSVTVLLHPSSVTAAQRTGRWQEVCQKQSKYLLVFTDVTSKALRPSVKAVHTSCDLRGLASKYSTATLDLWASVIFVNLASKIPQRNKHRNKSTTKNHKRFWQFS